MSEETPKAGAPKRPAVLEFNMPGSTKTLRASYRQKLSLPDVQKFSRELNGESDRAAVILAASQLDDLLANAIALKMPFDLLVSDMEHIFRQGGPLESFSARTEIACLFGIIEQETYEQLMILREMRNACAHSKHPISFKDPVLANVAMNLFEPRGDTPRIIAEKDIKAAFGLEISFLTSVLAQGSRADGRAVRDEAFRQSVLDAVEWLKASREKPTEP